MRCLIIHIVVLIGIAFHGWAQTPLIESYSLGNSNDKATFNTIFQDSNNFIWFGTSKGLIRFDGSRQLAFLDTAKDMQVKSIAQGATGELWLGMASGSIYTMQESNIKFFEPARDLIAEPISDMLFDSQGILWIASEGDGLYYYANNRIYRIDEEEGMPDMFVYDLMLDWKGRIWACTDNGIAMCSLKDGKVTIELLNREHGLPDDIIKKALLTPEGNVWIATEDKGFFLWDPLKLSVWQPFPNWAHGSIEDMDLEDGQLWVATKKTGIIAYQFRTNQLRLYTQYDGLKEQNFCAIKKDVEGNIWFVGKKNIYRSYSNQVAFVDNMLPATMQENVIDLVGKGDSIWFINDEGLFLMKYNIEGAAFVAKHLAVAKNEAFISLHADNRGSVWVGTYGNGLIRYHYATGKQERFLKELSNGNIMDITGKDSNIYLSTLNGITKVTIQKNNSATFEVFGKEYGLDANYIYQIFIDSQNRTWIATDGKGVLLWTGQKFQAFSENEGIKDHTVYGFAEDGNHDIWVNTLNHGVYRYRDGKFLHLYEEHGLKDRGIQSIGTDSQGNIVIMHDIGLEVLDIATLRFHLFDNKYGIKDKKPNLNAMSQDANGNLMIGTNKGIVVFRGTKLDGAIPSFPLIDKIKVLGQPVDATKLLSLEHDQNHISIEYLGLSFLDPKGMLFMYRLDNYEREWLLSSNTSVTYSNLPPGEYTFRVKVSHDQQFENQNEAVISFTIKPPIWSRAWFQLLALLLVSFSVYTFIQRRERKLREDKVLLEEKVQMRTAEIQEQNEELKSQRDQIKAQNDAILNSSEKLEEAFKAIEKKNGNITKSINYAKRIQTSILPPKATLKSIFDNHFIYYQPKDVVSGDFYWLYEVKNRVYFALVDCTGHGVPGAFMSLIGYSKLNEIISRNPFISPAEALRMLNEGVIDALRQDEERQTGVSTSDGMDLSLMCWDKHENMLSFGLSKRPVIVVEDGVLCEIKGDKMSIGGKRMGQDQDFTDHLFPIGKGLTVYMFSDGYADQFGGPDGKKLGTKFVRETITAHHHLPMEEQFDIYKTQFEDWRGQEQQIDDVLLIGITFKGY